MGKKIIVILVLFCVMASFTAVPQQSFAGERGAEAFRSTNLPLPRFASLASGRVFVRAGPGAKYPILWVFERKHYPVEIVLEYENWRKVRDKDGEEGWIHLSLLSGRRYGMVTANEQALAYRKPSPDSTVMAQLEPGVVARISECEQSFCKMSADGYQGWIERKLIWGVYEHENLN